ncbi:DUF805 domain-containing protein, partial [Propionibacterium freudenreichii]|uniref:DUF805 domain-containing protein n=1 Tax=Propionibacterium freudenreichii TaxID=1744 RepID=UPI00254C7D05
MSPLEAIKSCFRNYVNPNGRSGRAEFWWFLFFILVVDSVLGLLAVLTGDHTTLADDGWFYAYMSHNVWFNALGWVFSLAMLLPFIMVQIRRFHDQDRAMSRRRSNMGLAGEQSSECLGGREIAQSAAGSIVDLLGDGG